MSYSINEAKHELDEAIFNALDNRDGDTLRKLAERLDEENAATLLATAKAWEQEDDADWDYDRAVDNGTI